MNELSEFQLATLRAVAGTIGEDYDVLDLAVDLGTSESQVQEALKVLLHLGYIEKTGELTGPDSTPNYSPTDAGQRLVESSP